MLRSYWHWTHHIWAVRCLGTWKSHFCLCPCSWMSGSSVWVYYKCVSCSSVSATFIQWPWRSKQIMINCCFFMWTGVLFLLSGPLYLPSVKLMSCSDEAFWVLSVEICFWLLRREKRHLTEPSCWTWATRRLWRSTTTSASCSVMWTWSPWMTATPTSVSVSLDTCLCLWTSSPSGESTPHLSSVNQRLNFNFTFQWLQISNHNQNNKVAAFHLSEYALFICL